MTTSPSLSDFLSTARREFSFLVSEFGFVEQPDNRPCPNAYSVCYATPTTAVTVEGTNWGFGVQVMLRSVLPVPGAPQEVPLWALVEHRAPEESQLPSGQLAQLAYYASQLRRHADDVLRGIVTSFPVAQDGIDFHAAEAAKPKKRRLP
jgi:hypothetical protein